MSENLGSAVLELRADDQPLDRDMAGAEKNVGSRMKSMGAGLAKTGAGLTAGLTLPLLAFGKMAAGELQAIEQANNLTTASLKRMGDGSLVTVKGVQKLAGSLQAVSGIDDQLIQMGQNAILSFGGINTASKEGAALFKQASTVMVNFSEQTGTSVDAAGKQIAKSMAAASQGVLLLPKGIKLAGPEQEKLEKLLKSGASAAEKQAAVMDALGKKVEGAANLTNADKWAILKDRFAGIGAELLTRLLPLGDKLIGMLGGVMGFLEQMGPTTGLVVAGVLAFATALGPLLLGMGGLMMALPAVGGMLAALMGPVGLVILGLVALGVGLVALWKTNEDFRDGVKAAWESVKVGIVSVMGQLRATITTWVGWAKTIWSEYGDQIKAVARVAWSFISTFIGGQLQIVKGIITTVLAVLRGDWSDAWDGIKTILSGAWTVMTAGVRTAGGVLKSVLSSLWETMNARASSAWEGFKELASNAAGAIPGLVTKALASLPGLMTGAGSAAGQALATAMKNAVNAVLDKVRGIELPSVTVAGKTIGGGTPFSGLPRLARGGITKGLSFAGEAGPEAVVPLGSSSQNRRDRARVLAEAGLAGAGGGLVQNFHFNEQPDMFTVSRQAAFAARTAGLAG